MTHSTLLEGRIKRKLAGAEQQRREYLDSLRLRMDELEERMKRFDQIAHRLMENVVQPRMKIVAEHFDNASLSQHAHHCICRLGRTQRYPASTTLSLGIGHDDDVEHLLILYNLQILPVFFRFKNSDEMSIRFDQVDDQRFAAWVDSRLEEFVETYLSIEQSPWYQRENMVRDPVCGMTINKAMAAATAAYAGEQYYFCGDACRQKFKANLQRYGTGEK